MITSSAQNDAGLFELNFRDECYLPFEGAGAVESNWTLELPSKLRSFDYDTIFDVIVHISYTTKDGDAKFREDVENDVVRKQSQLTDCNGIIGEEREGPSPCNDRRRLLPPLDCCRSDAR
jgi:hypothetical protein